MFAFTPDGQGFCYSLESPNPNDAAPRSVRYHRFGSANSGDSEIFSVEAEGRPRLISWLSDSGRWMLHMVLRSSPRQRALYYHDLSNRQPARTLWEGVPSAFNPLLAGDRLFGLDMENAPNGRIIEIDIREGAFGRPREVLPEGATRIEQARIVGNRLLIVDTVDIAHRVRIYDLNGCRLGDIPLPGPGTVRLFPTRTNVVFLQYSSISTPPAIYRYDSDSGNLSLWRSRVPNGGLPKLEVRRERYTSKDGTAIPMTIFRRTGGSKPAPTILNGYGGFGASLTPEFTVLHTLLAEWGCVIAIPNIRGGSELGSAWHQAAKRRNRQTAFDDFAAAAEWLISEGWTQPESLGIIGGSNGGLLVGAALTQRPDLYKVAVSIGPLLDMLRYHRFGHAHFWTEEYGTVDDPEDFAVLHAYSPYHRVRDGVPYPATLLISGDADRRCDSSHVRKMAARLQHASSSGLPVLLDYSTTRGHSPTLPLEQRIESLTDRLAFLCQQLGVEAGS
jgi:prolyl oligopeptidase